MGKIPTRILFDNMSSAVSKILPKRERKLADAFSRFVLHHRFRAVFCNPNKGQEKGNVENKVEYQRRNYFVPLPIITNLEEYNKELLNTCDEDMKREYYVKKELIHDLLAQDIKEMLPLPADRFKVSRFEKAKTDNYSLVSFENNKYSTAPAYHKCTVWLEITADEVRVLNEKHEETAVHKRFYEQQKQPIIDWIKENVSTPADFLLSYRNLLDKPNDKSSTVPKNAPYQVPYNQNLSVYDGLIRGEH